MATEGTNTKISADPISAIANAVGSVFDFLGKGKDVDLAQKAVDNTKELLKTEKTKGQNAVDLEQIKLLEKKLDLQVTELNNKKELAKQKQQGSIFTLLIVFLLLGFIFYLVQKSLYPKPLPIMQNLPQTILIQQ